LSDKNYKIWGVSYGLIGDLIMALPVLNYFEKKYNNSYKYWVIQKKCSQCVDIFLNHPLIDNIRITENWETFGDSDFEIIKKCDISIPFDMKHENNLWYNEDGCVEETAKMAGILDLKDVLSDEEMKPKLYQWFNAGFINSINTGYTSEYDGSHNNFKKTISIWPFAGYGSLDKRSPSIKWWRELIEELIFNGYRIYQCGYINEKSLFENEKFFIINNLSFFEQIKISLATSFSIGTDSGVMWVLGAYSHPSINLMTYWLPNHNKNPFSLAPINDNGINIFNPESCDNIEIEEVMEKIKECQMKD